eukprot:m51a1_g12934 hypothetical protein (136) ;mRNA; r:2716-3123
MADSQLGGPVPLGDDGRVPIMDAGTGSAMIAGSIADEDIALPPCADVDVAAQALQGPLSATAGTGKVVHSIQTVCDSDGNVLYQSVVTYDDTGNVLSSSGPFRTATGPRGSGSDADISAERSELPAALTNTIFTP